MQIRFAYINIDMVRMNKEESLEKVVFVDKNGSIMYY